MQANSAHNRYIYYQDGASVYVNQYFDSDVTAEVNGRTVTIRQRNDTQSGYFRLNSEASAPQEIGSVTSKVLHDPDMKCVYFTVETDEPVNMTLKLRVPEWAEGVENEDGFVIYDREWKNGDTVCIRLPMKIRAEFLPDDDTMAAFTYGPVALAGLTDAETRLETGGGAPESVLMHDDERCWGSWSGRFKTVGQKKGLQFIPLYKVGYEPYEVYFPIGK